MADQNRNEQASDKGQPDDPRQSNESGEPESAGRSRGRVIDETGDATGKTEASEGTGSGAGKHTGAGPKGITGKVGEDLESGRQGAV